MKTLVLAVALTLLAGVAMIGLTRQSASAEDTLPAGTASINVTNA
jgi:hypothetical protein